MVRAYFAILVVDPNEEEVAQQLADARTLHSL
jgi:hypothetical protein